MLTLIVMVAWHSLPRLPERPDIALAAIGVALALAAASRAASAGQDALRPLVIVRNLTAATLVLAATKAAPDAFTALSAFGVAMYPLALWPRSSPAQ